MNVRRLVLPTLVVLLWAPLSSPAQRKTDGDAALPTEIVIGEQTFIDVGPPFGDYQIYILTGHANGTDVERLTLVPAGDACLQPPTIETATGSVAKNLSELLRAQNPCSIPNRALHHETKRCKHCAVFSGMHVTMQLECKSGIRKIPYEVLDRDLFDKHAGTPQHTSQVLELINSLNAALGGVGGIMDRPIFPTGLEPNALQPNPSIHLAELRDGKFDELFPNADEKVSDLYRQARLEHRSPSVQIVSSVPVSPIDPVLPVYPPIARAAHVQGNVELVFESNADGSISDASVSLGPPMLRAAALQAVKGWRFPVSSSSTAVKTTIRFDLNCPAPTKK